jgi:hypothetical protein
VCGVVERHEAVIAFSPNYAHIPCRGGLRT